MLDAMSAGESLPTNVSASLRPVVLDIELNLLSVQDELGNGLLKPDDRQYFETGADHLDDLSKYLDLRWWQVSKKRAEVDRVGDFIAP